MNITRKLLPSRMLIIYSIIISAIVGYAIYYAFTEGNTLIRIVGIIATLLIVLPVLRMPVSINEDNDTIRIKLIVGEKVFLKRAYYYSYKNEEFVLCSSVCYICLFILGLFLDKIYW